MTSATAHATVVEDVASTVQALLAFVFRFRRLDPPADPCAAQPCPSCFATHADKVRAFVEAGEPLHFVIPAFPAKSPSPRKVLGVLPDLGERLAIGFLQSFCEYIGHFHAPGARITICSDGHVFSDLIGIPDEAVSAYRRELRRMILDTGGGSIDLFSLEDAFGAGDFEHMRRRLVQGYADPLDEVWQRVRSDAAVRSTFNGLHRFLFEDRAGFHPHLSRSKLREQCKHLAADVLRRSNAWSSLAEEVFPSALRLSIHPQPSHGRKIGFHMIRTRDNWLTPWHGVVIDDGRRFTLVKRSEAEERNASLVWRNSRPSHYVAPQVLSEEARP